MLAWPENGKINIKSLSSTSEFAKGVNIKNAKLSGGKDNKNRPNLKMDCK